MVQPTPTLSCGPYDLLVAKDSPGLTQTVNLASPSCYSPRAVACCLAFLAFPRPINHVQKEQDMLQPMLQRSSRGQVSPSSQQGACVVIPSATASGACLEPSLIGAQKTTKKHILDPTNQVSGIPLDLGLGTRRLDPSVYVVFGDPN